MLDHMTDKPVKSYRQ